ncbi:kinase-like protein [Acaromyces ingoldii]|uniref:non-specific serine/threonine protein kinase n=1 Tax=Acaromyces ingoldii TaxID=215250 RepID=A0A316YS51_9BASI|nr:kinase-like protein [Acaromyces ingoldii]PWN91846.1 kinase-like protein [Acaromyces ingoldii]
MPPSSQYDRPRQHPAGSEGSGHPSKRRRDDHDDHRRGGGRYGEPSGSRDRDSRRREDEFERGAKRDYSANGSGASANGQRGYGGREVRDWDPREHNTSSSSSSGQKRPRDGVSVRFAESSTTNQGHTEYSSRDDRLSSDADIEYELQTEEDQARLIEERRKRRQAILLKHQNDATQLSIPSASDVQSPKTEQIRPSTSKTGTESPPSDEERKFEVELEKDFKDNQAGVQQRSGATTKDRGEGVSAAEYDPSIDRALDDARARERLNHHQNGTEEVTATGMAAGIGEAKERVEDREDGSDYEEVEVDEEDDVDDMFSFGDDDDGGNQEKKKKKTIRVKKGTVPSTAVPTSSAASLKDNWDDPDGYYRIILGERLGEKGRFQVFANLGRGMFSSVVKARDMMRDEKEVAIKIVRRQETMYKAGLKEMSVLEKLAKMDPEDKRHIIRLEGHFEHRNHLCMVFESKSMNLREVVKRFGKDVGLNLRAVRAYAHQMFLALSLMRKATIMHADIKPDNILVNETKSVLKICDLGSASDLSEMEITPYLVSRFYRAPEIILGLPYDCAIDMWSIGCTLYEVYTGQILFPGRSNNQMLLLHQELRGTKFTSKQLRRAQFSSHHFDEQNNFLSFSTVEKAAGAPLVRKVPQFTGGDGVLRERLLPANTARGLSDVELKLTNQFIDLLTKTLDLDAVRRITPQQALQHPFFSTP